MHHAERLVAGAHVLDEHAERDDVEELLEVAPGLDHLLMDRPQVLGPTVDHALDAVLGELVLQNLGDLVDVFLALLVVRLQLAEQVFVFTWIQVLE